MVKIATRVARAAPRATRRYRERLQDVIGAAAHVFRQKTYHGATMAQIAARAEMTKGNLYHYFPNKEALLYTCHERSLDIAFEALDLAWRADAPADERLRILLRHYVRGLTDELLAATILLEDGALSRRHFAKIVRRRDAFERGVRALVEAGIRDGIFAVTSPKMEGFVILGAVNWISKWYAPGGDLAPEVVADFYAERLVRGLMK